MYPAVQQTCRHSHTAPAIPQAHSCRTFGRSLQPPQLLRRSRKPKRIAAEGRQVDSEAPGNPLFANNPQFAAAFSQAVTRQGDEAVFSGAAAAPLEERTSPHEDMLLSSLQVSRRNIINYQSMAKMIENALKAEEQQFERLHFAYKKVKAEGAYIKQLERRLAEEKARHKSR
ncbi:TPA: hypothetical protein ACH3X2_007962 [Trebouxia sp. C0005]